MSLPSLILVLIAFIGWGAGAFLSKLAADRIGEQSVFWDVLGYFPTIILFSLLIFRFKNIIIQLQDDKIGILLAVISGLLGALAAISFYYLMTRSEASVVAPLTALYPALTVVLGILLLRESVNPVKVLGIILSLIAVWLLSR